MADPSNAAQTHLPYALPMPVRDVSADAQQPLGYVQIPLSTTTASRVTNVPAGARSAVLKVESGGMRYRDDGQDPTPTVGMPLASGEAMTYDVQMADLRLIAQEDGAVCNISYYGATS